MFRAIFICMVWRYHLTCHGLAFHYAISSLFAQLKTC
jgi:hypothetical protein